MIKLFSLKQEKAAEEASASDAGKKKIAPGLIRMQKGAHRSLAPCRCRERAHAVSYWNPTLPHFHGADMSELKLEKGMKMEFPNGKEDLMSFKVTISPDDGIYRAGKFVFDFKVPTSYPHDAPKVLCETTVFHPNIDMEGHVCLNILREDWKPVLTIQSIIMGLQFLMLEPNADDPLNKEVRRQPPSPPHANRCCRESFGPFLSAGCKDDGREPS